MKIVVIGGTGFIGTSWWRTSASAATRPCPHLHWQPAGGGNDRGRGPPRRGIDRVLNECSLVPGEGGHLGTITYRDWLDQSTAK